MIASLVKTQGMGGHTGLGLASQTRLLLTGCSAGARGAMMNLDYVQEMLGVAGLSEGAVSVQGLLDSPLWVDVAPLQPHVMPLANETRAAFEIFNATARLGPLCATTYPDPGDQWCVCAARRRRRVRLALTRFLWHSGAACLASGGCRCYRRHTC